MPRASKGQPFTKTPLASAAFINDLVDALAWVKQQRGRPGTIRSIPPWTDTVKVKNLTGADRARGEVVQLGDYLLDPVDPLALWFAGNIIAEPALDELAVLLEPLTPDDIGLAQISGVCTALIDVQDLGHGFAAPLNGEHTLKSCSAGPAQLLKQPTATGPQELPVKLGIAPLIYFHNASGETVPEFAVMKVLSGSMLGGRPLLEIDKPDKAFDATYVFNRGQTVPSDRLGAIQTEAVIRALGAGGVGDWMCPSNESWALSSGHAHAPLLRAIAGVGGSSFVGLQRPPRLNLRGKFYTRLTYNGTALFDVWAVDGETGEDGPTGERIEVHPWMMGPGDPPIDAGMEGEITYFPDSGRWYIANVQCPPI